MYARVFRGIQFLENRDPSYISNIPKNVFWQRAHQKSFKTISQLVNYWSLNIILQLGCVRMSKLKKI
jgi:hypothetical protein